MIREDDLREAIAECEGSRNPSASTCIKLASYYALLDRKTKGADHHEQDRGYSFASMPEIPYGKTLFSQAVSSKGISKCYPILEETMEALSVVMPALYNAMMRKLDSL